jgi:O-antigen/teichoic acid export membrane protein
MKLSDLFWLGGLRTILAIATIGNYLLATYILGVAEFGLLGLILTIHSFLSLFLISPGTQLFNNKILTWWGKGIFFSGLYKLIRYSVVLVFLIHYLIYAYWSDQGLPRPLLSSASISCLLIAAVWNASVVTALNFLGFSRKAAILQCATATTGVAISWALNLENANSVWWVTGQVAALLVTASIGHAQLLGMHKHEQVRCAQPFGRIGEIWRFCAPLALVAGLMWMLWNGWRTAVQQCLGIVTLGQMLAGYMLASYCWVFIDGILQQALLGTFFSKIQRQDEQAREAFRDFVLFALPVYIFCACGLLLLSPWVRQFILTNQFENVAIYFFWGVVVELMRLVTNLFAFSIQVHGNSRNLMMPYAIGLVISFVVIGGFWLFSELSAMTFMICVVVGGCITVPSMLTATRISIEKRRIFEACVPSGLIFLGLIVMSPMILNYSSLHLNALYTIFGGVLLTGTLVLSSKSLRSSYFRFNSPNAEHKVE